MMVGLVLCTGNAAVNEKGTDPVFMDFLCFFWILHFTVNI